MRHTPTILLAGLLVLTPFVFAQDSPEPLTWDDFPSDVRRAKNKYDAQAAKIQAAYDKAVAAADAVRQKALTDALKPFDTAIDAAVAKALANDDVDLALALKEAKESLNADRAPEDAIVGDWKAEWASGDRGTITFERGEKARTLGKAGKHRWETDGRWRVTDRHILIIWDTQIEGGRNHHWEAFQLPLPADGLAIGDSWQGPNSFKAKKVIKKPK